MSMITIRFEGYAWDVDQDSPTAVSLRLLGRHLNRAQRDVLAAEGFIPVIVRGKVSNKLWHFNDSYYRAYLDFSDRYYRVYYGLMANVAQYRLNGERMRYFNFWPGAAFNYPVGDVMLAQVIALQMFESQVHMVGCNFFASLDLRAKEMVKMARYRGEECSSLYQIPT